MGKYNNIGDTVEGISINCVARKWISRGLKKHPLTNKTMSLYVTDRNSTAEVLKSIGLPEDEDIKKRTSHFHRNIGDILQADALSVYIDEVKRLKPVVLGGVSGRHKSNCLETKKHTIAEVKVPLDNLRKYLECNCSKIEK